jgi:hypothetical protein
MSSIDQRDTPAAAGLSPAQYYQYVIQSVIITGILFSLWLARLNFRTGRGDRSGAARLASGFFALSMIAWALSTHWMGEMMSQWVAVLQGVARGLLLSGLAWVFYLALEPFVRRRSPQLIVSWTRLVSGRVRDPLVGRDALIGILLGAAFALFSKALPLVHQQVTGALPMPAVFDPQVLSGVLGGVTSIVNSVVTASINAMLIFFLFIALASFIPRRLGMVLFGLLVAGAFVADPAGASPAIAIAYAVVVAVALTLCLARAGLFTFVVAIAVASVLLAAPLTTDFGAWHARGMWVILLALAALLAWAFTSAAGIGHPRRAVPSPAR